MKCVEPRGCDGSVRLTLRTPHQKQPFHNQRSQLTFQHAASPSTIAASSDERRPDTTSAHQRTKRNRRRPASKEMLLLLPEREKDTDARTPVSYPLSVPILTPTTPPTRPGTTSGPRRHQPFSPGSPAR